MSYLAKGRHGRGGMTAWIIDEVWPEYRAFVAGRMQPEDQLLAPGLDGRSVLGRYAWDLPVSHGAGWATLRRHLAMRRVRDKSGRERQQAYLHHDGRVAAALARRLDYHADHLVIEQTFLPWFAASGLLGGRSYDVLMTRYPLAEVHRKLDAVAAEWEGSPTIADYRADAALADAEQRALGGAAGIVTPHHGIAALFPGKALLLDWQASLPKGPAAGRRVGFLGPTVARQGAHWVRERARGLAQPLVVFGSELEGVGFWDGVAIERRPFGADWLADIGAILHPAAMTNQPRRLLRAYEQGIEIYATPGSGLDPRHYRPLQAFTEEFGAGG
jgi:hypothetical protein